MGMKPNVGGRAGNIVKNSSLGFLTNVLPSILRFFTRYVFLMYFGDTLLGVNSLFTDVVAIFSFAEIGINAAVSYYLYKPIAEKDTERIQSFLALYRKLNRYIIVAVTVVGVCFIPFLQMIRTEEPIPGLLIYYLIFLGQNIVSYLFSYRMAYITAAQGAYHLAPINLGMAFATEAIQITVTIVTKNFTAYLLSNLLLLAVRVLWSNRVIVKRYPETCFRAVRPLDRETVRQFAKKTKSLFALKLLMLGVSQTDSVIVSTMVDVTQWGYVSNYIAVKKLVQLALSALASGLVPSIGNLSVVESREKQEDTFRLYNFCNTWLNVNIFTCLVTLVSPFIQLVFGRIRVLDSLTCFLLFFNVLFYGLLEAVSVLRDAMGLYERDMWVNAWTFIVNLVTSIVFVWLIGLPGVFLGTICSTLVTYVRIHRVIGQAFRGGSRYYYLQAFKAIVLSLALYGVLHAWIEPLIWNTFPTLWGLILLGAATVGITNVVFVAANWRNAYLSRSVQLALRFLPGRKR